MFIAEEKKWVAREEALRRELQEAREACSALESSGGGAGGGDGGAGGAGAVLAQLAQLQAAALDRDRAHAHTLRQRAIQLGAYFLINFVKFAII